MGSPVVGQTTGTLDLGASLVEYEGFLRSGAFVLAPAVRHAAANFSIGGQGSWTMFESGNQILQVTAAGAWLTAPRKSWRLELAGAVGASRYAQEPGTGHALGRTRIHVFGQRTGGWIGLTTGATFGDATRVPVEFAASAWSVENDLALLGTIAATRIDRDRHIDILGMARWTRKPLEFEARLGARPWARSDGEIGAPVSGAYGELSVLLSLGDRISVALSGGTSASDPVRRVLSATYVNAGLRVRLGREDGSAAPALRDPTNELARMRALDNTAEARLEIAADGEPRVIRVHARGARSVELMGDFTDWQAVALQQTRSGAWEIRLPLTSGIHRVNIRVDGGPWLVPAGARSEESEFGGVVGVVVVR